MQVPLLNAAGSYVWHLIGVPYGLIIVITVINFVAWWLVWTDGRVGLEAAALWFAFLALWSCNRVVGRIANPLEETGLLVVFEVLVLIAGPVLIYCLNSSQGMDLFAEPKTSWGRIYVAARDLLVITVLFTAVSVWVIQVGLASFARPLPRSARTWHVFWSYVWHFADEIPALNVPQTLNWQTVSIRAGFVSGSLLLLYKVAVILPIFTLVKRAWRSGRSATADHAQMATGGQLQLTTDGQLKLPLRREDHGPARSADSIARRRDRPGRHQFSA